MGLITVAAGLTLAATSVALAEGKGKGHHGKFFQKMDKNGDGFLTQAEVGDKKWNRIKVADANNDAKVSKAELMQAKKDGKLRRNKGGKKGTQA